MNMLARDLELDLNLECAGGEVKLDGWGSGRGMCRTDWMAGCGCGLVAAFALGDVDCAIDDPGTWGLIGVPV